MFQIIQFFVFFILVPAIYLAILAFDLLLIIRAKSLEQRWRSIAGVLVGFLITVIVVLLDQNVQPIIPRTVGDAFDTAWSSAVIAAVLGFLVLLGIDFLLRRGVISFIILFTVSGVLLSGYFLVNLTNIKTTTAVSTIGFLVGIILYFIFFPSRIFNAIRGKEEIKNG